MTNEEFIAKLELLLNTGLDKFPNIVAHAKKLVAVAVAAKEYKTYLPNMKIVGAAKYSAHLTKSMSLREAIENLERE